jgi:Ftsk/SpoIIIE family protein
LTPVATTADKALNILKRSVAEMLRRYDIASKINAKNLIEYNKKVTEEEKFSYIIIIIDELADLMMS